METEVNAEAVPNSSGKKKWIISLSVFFILVILTTLFLLFFVIQTKDSQYKDFYLSSLKKNNPEELQNFLKDEIRSGNNDKYTKSAAYFITHRYFDNKGDIYELYKYAHSDPLLAFLNKAETIYPEIFAKIKNNELPKTFSEEGTYAYLAYLEVLDDAGLGDVAMFGTAAGQYSKMAYISKNSSENADKKELTEQAKRDIAKALIFAEHAKNQVAAILDGTLTVEDVYVSDMVVGLNQYAYTLRYFKYFDVNFESSKTAEEIFDFTIKYTTERVPELGFFTHLSNASSLTMIGAEPRLVTEALRRLLIEDPLQKTREFSVLDRILKSRTEREPVGMYSKGNIISIAMKSPEFKDWLMKGGWEEADFR